MDCHLITVFYEDLKREVAGLQGIPVDSAAFRDVGDIFPGEDWSAELSAALCKASSFVYICSPTYFTRDFCGRELRVFQDRVEAYRAVKDLERPPPLAVPVLWMPLAHCRRALPDVARRLQYKHGDFGATYAKEGLAYLMGLSEYKDDYRKFRRRFASRLLEVAEAAPLPELQPHPKLAEVKSVFAVGREPAPGRDAPHPAVRGPGNVQFLLLVGSQEEVRRMRRNLDAYADSGRGWRPYLPEPDRPLSVLLQGIASDAGFISELAFDDDPVRAIDAVERDRSILVVVVDACSVEIQRFHGVLDALDKRNSPNCSIVVPWNRADGDLRSKGREIRQRVLTAFARQRFASAVDFRITEGSYEDFAAHLVDSLTEIQKKILTTQALANPIAGGGSLPGISATAGPK
jgi:FxsC-like protein